MNPTTTAEPNSGPTIPAPSPPRTDDGLDSRASQPDRRPLRGNGHLEQGELDRGNDQLARVLGW